MSGGGRARPGRLPVAAIAMGAAALFIAWDLAVSEPIDPFAAPAPAAWGSGVSSGGAHCAAAPG